MVKIKSFDIKRIVILMNINNWSSDHSSIDGRRKILRKFVSVDGGGHEHNLDLAGV